MAKFILLCSPAEVIWIYQLELAPPPPELPPPEELEEELDEELNEEFEAARLRSLS